MYKSHVLLNDSMDFNMTGSIACIYQNLRSNWGHFISNSAEVRISDCNTTISLHNQCNFENLSEQIKANNKFIKKIRIIISELEKFISFIDTQNSHLCDEINNNRRG